MSAQASPAPAVDGAAGGGSPEPLGPGEAARVAARLLDLIDALRGAFDPREEAAVVRLVHLRRPGEALLQLAWMVVEQDVVLAPAVMAEVTALGAVLVDPDDFPYGFEAHVLAGDPPGPGSPEPAGCQRESTPLT